jgi:enolase
MAGPLIARFESNEEALTILSNLIEEEGYTPGHDFGIYLDIAANQFYRDGEYHLSAEGRVLSTDGMIAWLEGLCDNYPIISMEDCLFEEDWEAWGKLTDRIGGRVQLVGDDLFVTDAERLSKGIELGVANAIVIKLNQAGTVTETIETIRAAQRAGYGTVVSPRSGELWDPYITHLCVGQNLRQGKISGAYTGGEANLNELNRIQEYLGERAHYAGRSALSRFTSA